MNTITKFEQFQKAYDEAIQYIKSCLVPRPFEPQMNGLVQWLLDTDANPYGYLPQSWAGATSTAEGFASLLQHIHHAVYDDGDITFVTVNGEPRIVFAHPSDTYFRNSVLTSQEQSFETKNHNYKIEVLDITPNEFGPIFEAYHTEWVKNCFMSDASRGEIEWSANHYRKYKCWDEAWIKECGDQIAERSHILKETGIIS